MLQVSYINYGHTNVYLLGVGFTFSVDACVASWLLEHFLYFLMGYGLDRLLLSESIRGYMYIAGCPAHSHFSLSAHSESLASGSQLDNRPKLIFYRSYFWGLIIVVRSSLCGSSIITLKLLSPSNNF